MEEASRKAQAQLRRTPKSPFFSYTLLSATMTSRASNGFCNCADVDNVADALLNMNGDQRSAALIRHNQTCVCDSCTYCAKLRGFSCLHSVALCDSYRDDNMLSGTMAVHNEWCPCRCYRCD